MTPTESREAALALSRERLARATLRLERLTRNAVERINHLNEERREIGTRLATLETRYAQEKQNFDQRTSLLTSVKAEAEERTKEFAALSTQLAEQEKLLNEQSQAIARLESELEIRNAELHNKNARTTQWEAELATWKEKAAQLEERVKTASNERDNLRAKLYENERTNAQFLLHLTSDERDKAAKAIDNLIDQISGAESRAILSNKQ